MRREILEHPHVQEFLAQHADELNYDNVERNLPKLHEFISQSTECCGCDNTEHCTNYLKGFLPTLRVVRILLKWTMCAVSKRYGKKNVEMLRI